MLYVFADSTTVYAPVEELCLGVFREYGKIWEMELH